MTNLCPHRVDSTMGQLGQGNKTLNSCLSNKLHKVRRNQQLPLLWTLIGLRQKDGNKVMKAV